MPAEAVLTSSTENSLGVMVHFTHFTLQDLSVISLAGVHSLRSREPAWLKAVKEVFVVASSAEAPLFSLEHIGLDKQHG